MNKIPPQMDIAAKLAKRGTAAVFFGIHLPLLRPTAAAARRHDSVGRIQRIADDFNLAPLQL